MKKLFILALILPFIALSCSNDLETDPNGIGSITLKPSIDDEAEEFNTRATSTDYTTYYIILDGPGGSNTIPYPASGQIDNLRTGSYTITVTSHPGGFTPAFDEQVYAGSTTVTVTANNSTNADIVCTQANAGVFFVYDESLAASGLTDLVPTVTMGANALVYSGSNHEATGYFNSGRATITLKNNGKDMSLDDKSNAYLDLAARQLWKVTLRGSVAAEGGIQINVTVEELTGFTHEDEFVVGGSGEEELAAESNTYLIAPGSTVNIPVSRAYKVWSDEFGQTISGTPGVRILWIDNAKGLGDNSTIKSYELVDGDTPQDAYIAVRTGASDGNALIAYTLDGDTYWSWHIWVTDYDPDNGGTTYTHQGENLDLVHIFMDRSVGALEDHGSPESHGFLYQWGRKDPFPSAGYVNNDLEVFGRYIYDENGNQLQDTDYWTTPADGIHNVDITASDNIPESVKDPLAFYVGMDMVENWWGDGEVSALWTNYSSPKSVFDPCPVGWRVPSGEWHMVGVENTYFDPWSSVVNSTSVGDSYMFFRQFGYIPLYGDKLGHNGEFSRAIGTLSGLWTADYIDFYGTPLFYYGAFSRSGLSSGAQAEAAAGLAPNDGYAVRCERE